MYEYRCVNNLGFENFFEKNITYFGTPKNEFIAMENAYGETIQVFANRFLKIN
jgi:hypothetical protein